MSSQADTTAIDALDALTAGITAGEDAQDLMAHLGEAGAETEALADIIQALHKAVAPVEPGSAFAAELRAELLGEHPGMVKRVRQMPARVHVAAALALIAGCLLFMLRRLFGSGAPQDIQEEAVATPF